MRMACRARPCGNVHAKTSEGTIYSHPRAGVAELVDALDLGSSGATRGGSSPLARIIGRRTCAFDVAYDNCSERHVPIMMKTTVERLADDKLRLDIEVPEAILQEAVDATLEMMGREMRMPGFRPGKVPTQAVLARVGREGAQAEAVRMFLDDWYAAAVMGAGIRPIAAPDIDFPEEDGDGFRFSATVSVVKKPKLPELKKLQVDKPNLPDTQQYVDQVLNATLRGVGTLVDVDGTAEQGDEVVVDFHCEIDGERVDGAAAVGYQARIGDGRLLAELETAIVGQAAGAELDVPVTFEADHPMPDLAGKDAIFKLTLRKVERMEIPELSDDIAMQVSEFSTADELLADIRSSITARLEQEVAGIFRANAVTALAKEADLEEPAMLVERRQTELYNQMRDQLAQSGLSIESYLAGTGRDMESLFAELEQSARDDLRRELCLLALAEELEIAVGEDDLRAEISEHATHSGEDPEETFRRIAATGRLDMLRGELLIQRTIDHLIDTVKAVAVDLPVGPSSSDASASEDAS